MAKNSKNKIRIRLKAYESKALDETLKLITDIAQTTGSTCAAVPLPSKLIRTAIHNSTHVHGRSKEHYQLVVSNGVVDITKPTDATIDALKKLSVKQGVEIQIKM